VERCLQRTVPATKRAGDHPWRRMLLGCTCTRRRALRRPVRAQARKALKPEGRQRPCRTRGLSLLRVVQALRQSRDGGDASFRVAAGPATGKERDAWIRRRRRCYVWKQWGRRRYRELGPRGGSRDRAWKTCKSAPGPWRFSRRPALAIALPGSV
jgi:hypothetical protein